MAHARLRLVARVFARRPQLILGIALITYSCRSDREPRATSQTDSHAAATSSLGPADTSPPPAGLPVGFSLADSAAYSTASNEGMRAVLRATGTLIDTVEAGFGVHQVGRDSVLYQPVRGPQDSVEGENFYDLGEYTLYYHGQRSEVTKVVPYLDRCFSRPVVDGADVYYWGLALRTTLRAYAARFNFRTHAVDTLRLAGFEIPGTDNCGFLPAPYRDSTGFRFGAYRVSRTFRDYTTEADGARR